jgi:hypothetical protein
LSYIFLFISISVYQYSTDARRAQASGFNVPLLPGILSVGKKWKVQLRFSGNTWAFGTFETLQTANYVCHIARGIVGYGSADMKDNILNVDLAKMAIDAGLKALL